MNILDSSRIMLGMVTPSSNTVLEPLTTDIVSGLPNVTAHFSRFRVTEIGLSGHALAQFNLSHQVDAARLLADARCQVIGWSGTSASWLGFDADIRLCEAIEAETGARACTSVLALNELLRLHNVSNLALLTPYKADVQSAIVSNYRDLGVACSEVHLGLEDNYSFCQTTHEQLREMAHRAMAVTPRPQAIAILCTNIQGADLAVELEQRYGVPVFDSVSTVVWKALQLAKKRTSGLAARWGRLFA